MAGTLGGPTAEVPDEAKAKAEEEAKAAAKEKFKDMMERYVKGEASHQEAINFFGIRDDQGGIAGLFEMFEMRVIRKVSMGMARGVLEAMDKH